MQTISKPLKILLSALIVSNIVFMVCIVYLYLDNKQSFNAERININDASGKNRVVIANTDHIPMPIIDGKMYKRAYSPAGIIFYDKNGDERGGLAITDNKETNLNALAFDYQNADAIGILAQDNKHDNYFRAGLLINDKDLSGKPGQNINRINLLTENGNAALVIKDNNEIPRIILKVDSLGNPSIEMFDKSGKLNWKQ
ncbi:hypothetical protein KUH03_30855 [Sphingobacterium sp. E70]|uniref:hypothetical protein n=1 Tax=Sphingobacterium sp. E70 TaxID=2853439 RepID=UPI00211C62D8|nr:hypothetical protein [Sphingobacterium sp. E70]ULT23537.1 hypothetical protein KUH03_30855 [Sphingobacterium sp. E70]